jgi:tRNA nucleotidyltransferase (CCA-adding enzyme)
VGQLAPELIRVVPEDVHALSATLRSAGWRVWIVGGCTRDLLLGREVHDWDVATDAQPADVMKLFRRVIPTGVQHGTVTVMKGRTGYEVTTLRGEGAYTDGRHPDAVVFVRDLDEDLSRRDFTINAIALDPASGELTDPFGGERDLRARLIRAVGEPERRFNEDGLRLMRAARFAAVLQFDVEPATHAAMASCAAMLEKISAERVRDELLKTLLAPRPSSGIELMVATGLLDHVLPELRSLIGCEQNRYHRYDVFKHTMHVVDACRGDAELRLAALLHDVGKPAVRGVHDKTGDYTFYSHEVAGARMADAVCARLRLSNHQRERVVMLVRNHLVVYEDEWTDAAVRRWVKKVGEGNVEHLLEIARADCAGKGVDAVPQLQNLDRLRARVQQLAAQGLALSVRDLAVGGRDLMQHLGVPPGPAMGEMLQALLDAVIDDPSINTPEQLLDRAATLLPVGGGTAKP